MTLVTGTNKIYMTADFDGLPLNGGPGSDYFGTYPVPFAVSTNPIGTRSKLVFNTSTKPYVSFPSEMNETQIPYFHVSAYDGYSNKISTGGDMSRISLGFEPSLTSGFNMSDEGNGLYKVLVNTTTAAAYKVSLYINGALSVASPFTFQIYSGNFSSKSFADYPDQSLAGIKKDFLVYPRDWFGNAIEYNSPHGSVADRLKLEVTNIDTNAVTLNAQEFVWQTDGTYLCNFTAPTNAFSNYYLDVHFLNETDATSKLFKLPAQTSNILDILGSYPNPAKSQYFVTDNQKAGAVILGVVGIDDYGNRSPHFWSRWSASLDLVAAEGALNLGLVTALATSGIYNISEGGSVQIPFGVSVNISGSYEVKFYYDGNPVDGVPITATTVLPADIGMYSTVSTIPETTSLGQLVTVDIGSYDSFNNKISTGGQGDLMEIKIYKQSDFTDTVTYSIIDNGDGSYQVKFSPERSGIYVFEVKYKSDGKAFTQTFDVKFEFALPEHFEAILPSKFDAGVEATVVVQPIQGVDIAAAAKSVIIAQLREANSSTSTNLTVSTADAEGKRSFKVLETKSGDYFIDIFLEGKHVGSSPYNVTILPGPIFSTKVVPMAQTTYYSDDTIELTLELYDTYNNSALVDIANDISVKYYQLPEGLIVEADVTKTSHGYVAATKLTLAAIYKVQIIIKGIQICVEGEAECTPSVTILPGEVNALTSLLEGNGLGNTIAAGIEGNVRVVPLDTYSNLAQESKSQLMDYTLNIFSAANSSQVGSPLSLVFSALDASHAVSYVLTEAGKYQMQVVQQDNATVSGKMVDVEVLPSEVLVSNTEIEVGTQTVAVGSAGSIRVTLKDQYENIIQKDLGTEVGVVLTNPSKVLSSAAGDVSLTFASGTYDATFSTTAAGEYAVSVEIYGISVRSNTTVTFVPEVPYALATIARLAGNGLGIAGQKNILYIDGKDKYGNARTQEGGNYTVEVSVPDGTSTKKRFPSEISLFWNAQGMIPFYQVEFVSEPKGLTWVTVELDGLPVVGSPFSITVSPGPIYPEKCVLSGPGTTGGILNQQTFFEIQSMDSFGNERTVGGDKFEISLKGTNSQSTTVAVAVTDLNNVKYDVRYILNSLGTFTLEVKLGLQDVGLLPVRSPLVVSSKNTAGTINVIMSQVFGLSPAIAAGDQLTITIIALDSEGFQLTTGGENFVASVWLTGLSQFKTEFQSVDLLNGTYLIEYERSVKGNYELELHHVASDTGVKTFVGTKVLNYPYQVECIPGLTMAEESYILPPGIPATVPAGTFQSIYVQSMDKFKNRQSHRDGVEDMWSITGSRVDSPVPLAVASTRTKSGSTGLYELAFKLPDIGVYNVSVQLTNQTGVYLVGSSALVEGIPGGLAPSKVYTLDTGKMASVVGNVTEISFLPRDISGNVIPSLSTVPNCTVTLEPAVGQRTSSCEYRSSVNSFFASYSATKSGAKSLSILLNGEHILGSPFAFTIEPGTPASATAAGIDFSGVQVNEKLSPTITLADQYGNKILNGDAEVTVEVVGIFNTGVLRFEGFMENYGNGTYRAQVQVQSAGSFQFYVSDETSVLLNSTLTVNPLPTSAASSYLSPSANFDGNKFQVEAGSIIEANIIAIAEDGNQQQGVVDAFSVSIDPDSAYLASVIDSSAVSTSTSGKYSFRFQTKRVLSTGYLLSVKLGGSDVKGSPFPVTVGPGEPQAVQSNIYSGDYAYDASLGDFGSVAGIGRKFLLQLRDDYGNDLDQEAASASGNKLSIKVDGVSNVTTAVVGLPDGRYEMFYSVTKAGSFFLQAQLSGVNVGGGSSILVVAGDNDFSMFNVYGPGISSDATVGYTYHFNIEARDMFGNTRQDDGSTLNLISVLMVSRTTDRDTGAVVDTNFELVQVKYESAASTSESSETWSAGSFRVMFKTTVAGEIRATISACPQGGMTCSHIESDLDRYNVQAQAIGTSPYSAQSALSRGMSATTLSGVGLQGGVITSSDTSEFVDTGPLPIVIEPRDLYGNIVALDPSESSNFEVSVEASSSTIIDSMLGEMGIGGTTGDTNVVISNVVAVEGNQGFTFNLTAAGVGDYFMDIKYKGSLLTANSVLITVYSSYPPIDPAQCIDFGGIYDFCVVGQTCQSSVQLFTEAKDSTCYTDQSTGKVMVLPSQRYEQISTRPSECKGIFYPFSKTTGVDSYVTVLADSNRVNDISDDLKGTYSASMAFSISGLHTVETKVGPDPDSRWIQTITVPIADGKTKVIKVFSANTTELFVATYPSLALSGQNVTVLIQPKDKFGNNQDYVGAIEDRIELNYTSDTFLEYPSSLTKKRSTTSSIPFFYHEATYMPQKPGMYSGQVHHGYSGIEATTPMSLPFTLEVLPGIPDATTSVVSGLGIYSTEVYQAGSIVVELRDEYNNKVGDGTRQKELLPSAFDGISVLDVGFVDSSSIQWQALKQYNAETQVFDSVYVSNATGLLNLKVNITGKEVVLNNYVGTVIKAGSISEAMTSAEGPGIGDTGALSAGNPVSFKILAKDSYGNNLVNGGSVFKVVIQSVVLSTNGIDYVPDGQATTSAPVVDNSDGTYQVDYTLQLASYYHVEVTRGSQGIKGSPFLVRVLPGPTNAAASLVYCEDDQQNCPLESISVGKQGLFYIQAKDEFGGNKADFADQFFYSVVGGGLSKSSFAQVRDITKPGQYKGTFFTNTAGPVDLTVRLMGNLVYETSIMVVPGAATAFNSEVVSPLFPSSTVATSAQTVEPKVFVVTKDSYGNKLTTGGMTEEITLSFQPKNGNVLIAATLVDEGDGTYSGSVTMKKAGQYVVKATLKGESLDNKDLLLNPAKLVPANTLVYAQGGSAYTAGENCTILIQTLDEWYNVRDSGSDLDDSIASVELSLVSTESMVTYKGDSLSKTFSEVDGQYRITFVPELAGVVRLKLVLDGTDVIDQTTQSDWQQQVLAGDPDATKSIAFGTGITKSLSAIPAKFNIKLLDKFGNPMSGNCNLNVCASKTSYLEKLSMEFALVGSGPSLNAISSTIKEASGNGFYEASYTPPAHASNYQIQIKLSLQTDSGPVEFQSSIATVYKEAGEVSYPNTVITKDSGEGLDSFSTITTSAGVVNKVYFQLADAIGVSVLTSPSEDWLEITAVPPVKSTSVVEVSPGYWAAESLAEEIGDYKLSFVGGGVPLGESSGISQPEYYLTVIPGWPSSAAQSKHSFYDTNNLMAGVPFSFVISAYDAFGTPRETKALFTDRKGLGQLCTRRTSL